MDGIRGIYQFGSSKKKIKKSVSTTNGSFQSYDSRVKKPTPSLFCSKKRKLINVAGPLTHTQKLKNLCKKEEVARSNVVLSSSALEVENSVIARSAELSRTKKDVYVTTDLVQQSFDNPLAINMHLSQNAEDFSMKNGQCSKSSDRPQSLIECLTELSQRFKILSSQPINIDTSKNDGSCSTQCTVDNLEAKNSRFPLSSKLDCNSITKSFAISEEKFKARSIGLKESLVDECLDFFNNASKEELKQLKGIGEKRATYILELREETPEPFKKIDDLKRLGLSSKQENSVIARSAELSKTKKDVYVTTDLVQQSFDNPLAINMHLSQNAEDFSMKNGQCSKSSDRPQSLTECLTELSQRFKILSSQPINIDTSKNDGSCSTQCMVDNLEAKNSRFPLSSKLDCNSITKSFAIPEEKFKARSIGLKESLVDECLDFFNNASKEELKQLKGIGEKRATYILELREETSEPFKKIDDLKRLDLSLKQIKGIMSKILADI